MSLFTDLKEVLTPYAQRIKGLAAADEQIKADLGALATALETNTYWDFEWYAESKEFPAGRAGCLRNI